MLSRMLSTLTRLRFTLGYAALLGRCVVCSGRRRVACANPGRHDPTHAPPSIDAPGYPGQVTDLTALKKVA
jgi:hypothetical protein